MERSYNEAYYKQIILTLEAKNKLLEKQFRKQKIISGRLETERNELAGRTLKEMLRMRLLKHTKDYSRIVPENDLTWLLIAENSDSVDLCRSFCRHHPDFSGDIYIARVAQDQTISEKIDGLLSVYDQSHITREDFRECRNLPWRVLNLVSDKIETGWIIYIDSKFYVSEPFIGELRNELFYSGCHFMNLPATFPDSLKTIKQRIEVDSEWDDTGECIVIPSKEEGASDIPEFARIFSGDSGVFKKADFIEFGKYSEQYRDLSDIEFSSRIAEHNYAVANLSRPVLVSRGDISRVCEGEELDLYNTAVGKLRFDVREEPRRKRAAIVIDEEGWAYYNIAVQLKKNITNMDIDIFYSKYADSIVELFFVLKNYDLVHVVWRGILQFLTPETISYELQRYGMTYHEFEKDFLRQICLTAAVYDHLYLDENTSGITNQILSLVDEYTVCSEKLIEIYNERFEKKPAEEITDGVDLGMFYPQNLSRFNEADKREIRIGWVGNSVFWGNRSDDLKGVYTILNPALEELQAEGHNIRKFFADKQERVIPHEKMRDYYSEIDIYICASRIEGTPNPVLEAMACGVPVISTDVGIVPEAFGEFQKQFILEKRDVECMKNKIRKMISDPENMKRCSQENLRQIQKWSWEGKCGQYERFFEAALERKARKRME